MHTDTTAAAKRAARRWAATLLLGALASLGGISARAQEPAQGPGGVTRRPIAASQQPAAEDELIVPQAPQPLPPAGGLSGELQVIGDGGAVVGACPLKHTDVQADIVGYVARVTVKQVFHNPTDRKIEAVYVFPLPQDAAVDDMTMTVGDRQIVGLIKLREEARQIYEQARAAGHVAGLLEQERPNIFTQSVANIEPGAEVTIEIRFVETLKYEDGVFEWVFPMVVGPRYIPGGGSAPGPMTNGRDTPEVPDGSRISPPVTPKGTRAGHDIGLTVSLDGGTKLYDVQCELHQVDMQLDGARANVTLKNRQEIPNRDFVLHYRLADEEIGDAFLMHEDERGRFFTLVLHPPQRVVPAQVMPRELIFVLDTSGSMQGFPIDKAKDTMSRMVGAMLPSDRFNVITFSGDTHVLWEHARPATRENVSEAQKFLASREGAGGTEMMKAIHVALAPEGQAAPGTAAPIRIVCFMTDGYVGNDMAIIDAVQKFAGTTRVFSFGIGNAVNRLLLEGMARAGRGEVEYVTLSGDAEKSCQRFHERLQAPVLTDIQVDWGDLPVADVYPQRVPDLFSAKPIMIHGRLTGEPRGSIVLRGNTGAGPYAEQIDIAWPDRTPHHDALASLWARAKVESLISQDYAAAQAGNFPETLKNQVVELGLQFRLLTQFTSFVAVEELTVTAGGEPVKVQVPVEMPDGVSYQGVFGESGPGMRGVVTMRMSAAGAVGVPAASPPSPQGGGGQSVFGGAPAERRRVARDSYDEIKPPEAREKLAPALAGLAAKVEKDGHDGTLTIGRMKVVGWRVDVMVLLADTSEKTLAVLRELGFTQTGESKATRLLIGTIDVRKLEELSKLDTVLSIRPVVE